MLRAEPGQLYELSDGEHVWLGRIERVATSKRGDSRIEFALVEPIAAREPACNSIPDFHCEIRPLRVVPGKGHGTGRDENFSAGRARDKALLAAAGKRRALGEDSGRVGAAIAALAAAGQRLIIAEKAFAEIQASLKIMLSERRSAA